MMVKLLSATLLMSKAGIFGDVASDMAVAFLALERIRLDLTCESVAPGARAPISFLDLNPSCFSGSGAAHDVASAAKPTPARMRADPASQALAMMNERGS